MASMQTSSYTLEMKEIQKADESTIVCHIMSSIFQIAMKSRLHKPS